MAKTILSTELTKLLTTKVGHSRRGFKIAEPFYTRVTNHQVPDYTIQIDQQNENLFTIDFQDVIFDRSASSVPKKLELPKRKFEHFQHDFTFGCFVDETDYNLNQFLPYRQQKETPDWVFKIGKNLIVIEFTTTQSCNEHSLRKAFNLKQLTYEETLKSRLDELHSKGNYSINAIEFYIIVVSPVSVLTNLPNYSEEEFSETAHELSWRLNIGLDILHNLERMGKYEPKNQGLSERKKLVRGVFEQISFDWEETSKYKPFSEQAYNEWISPITNADVKYCEDVVFKSLQRSRINIMKDNFVSPTNNFQNQLVLNGHHCVSLVKEFKEQKNMEFRLELSPKAVVQLPLIYPNTKPFSTKVKDLDLGNSDDSTFYYWKCAFDSKLKNPRNFVDQSPEELLSSILETNKSDIKDPAIVSDSIHCDKKDYHRVTVETCHRAAIEVAKVGIDGKRYMHYPEVQLYRKDKKKPFNLGTNTSDIDHFLNSLDLSTYFQSSQRQSDIYQSIQGAASIHNCEDSFKLIGIHKRFMDSKMGHFCQFVSDVAIELDLSLKQHVLHNQFILKKLAHSDVYLLIKSTEASKHIFVSFLWLNKDVSKDDSTVFKSVNSNDVCSWTDFVSFNVSKLVNLAKCESIMSGLFFHWCEFYNLTFWEDSLADVKFSKAWRATKLNLLTLLSDKHTTEEIFTLNRYVYMEGFTSYPCVPKPYKMLEKLSNRPRTRLEVWAINKTLNSMVTISRAPFTGEVKGDQFHWNRIIHPYFSEFLNSPYHLINLFYIGYLKNKEEFAEANSISMMYEKILQLEDVQPESDTFLSIGNPTDPQKHEFSCALIKNAVDMAKRSLQSKLGMDIEKRIELEILNHLGYEDLESFCTLKASSTFCGMKESIESIQKPVSKRLLVSGTQNQQKYQRIERKKVIIAMKPILEDLKDDQTLVIQAMPSSLKRLLKKECMHIDIFRKPQHGGLREIYVMEIDARICQKILEGIARSICRLFDSETMTNPSSKTNLPRDHYRKAKNLKTHITSCTSDDAAKWNQGHFVTKFALMLVRFAPKYMHPFIIKCCQLWMKKKIQIDPALLEILNSLNTEYDSPSFLHYFSLVHKGVIKRPWHKPQTTYIQTRSGMMQGILHYTSSLFHTIFLNFYRSTCESYLKQRKVDYVFTHMQSSDDSSVLLTMSSHQRKLTEMTTYSSILFEFKSLLGLFFGIYMSSKRTMNTLNMFEFNSEYFFGGNLYRPTFRWITASMNISEQESLASRQEEMSNLLKDCIEGGSSFSVGFMVQISQALLHYRLLGSSVSPLFRECLGLITESRDPALGFFLCDNMFMAGLAGFQYNLYLECSNSVLGRKYSNYLQKRQKTIALDGKIKTLEVTTTGAFVGSSNIRFGDRKRWERLLNDFKVNPDEIYNYLEEDPSTLYRRSENKKELMMKLSLKLLNPGVIQSLSKGNALSKVIASSVFILSKSVVSDQGSWFKSNQQGKRSLYQHILSQRTMNQGSQLTEEQLFHLFPFKEDYDDLKSNVSRHSTIQGSIDFAYPRSVRTKLNMQENDSGYVFPPDKLAANIWFGFQTIAAASRVRRQHWDSLKVSIPWLQDNFQATLESSPFLNHCQLQNFLSRLNRAKRIIRVTGTPISTSGGHSSIITAIHQGFFPGFKLSSQKSKDFETGWPRNILHQLRLAFEMPYTDEYLYTKINSILTQSSLKYNTTFGSTRKNSLALIKEYLSTLGPMKMSTTTTLDKIYDHKLGTIGHWLTVQRWDKEANMYSGMGEWSGRIENCDLILRVYDKTIKRIFVKNEFAFRNAIPLFKQLIMDLDFEFPDGPGEPQGKLWLDRKGLNRLGNGIEVETLVNSEYYYDPSLIKNLTLNIDKRQRVIRLYANYYNDNRPYTILSFSSKDKDIIVSPGDEYQLEKLLEKAWFTMSSLDAHIAEGLLKDIGIKKETQNKFDVSDFMDWSKEMIVKSLTMKKILMQDNYDVVLPDSMDDLSELFADMMDGAKSVMCLDDIETDRVGQDEQEVILQDLSFAGLDISVVEKSDTSNIDFHPLFSNLVSKWLNETTGSALHLMLYSNKYYKKDEDIARIICRLNRVQFKDMVQIEKTRESVDLDDII